MFCCGDYIIPLIEAICYFYVFFRAATAVKVEIYITFLAESHVGSFSNNKEIGAVKLVIPADGVNNYSKTLGGLILSGGDQTSTYSVSFSPYKLWLMEE